MLFEKILNIDETDEEYNNIPKHDFVDIFLSIFEHISVDEIYPNDIFGTIEWCLTNKQLKLHRELLKKNKEYEKNNDCFDGIIITNYYRSNNDDNHDY